MPPCGNLAILLSPVPVSPRGQSCGQQVGVLTLGNILGRGWVQLISFRLSHAQNSCAGGMRTIPDEQPGKGSAGWSSGSWH